MTSAVSMVTSLMQVPSCIDGTAATIAFANWHPRFGLAINHLRSLFSGLVQVCVGCGLSRIRDFDTVLAPPRAAGGH